MRKNTSFPDRGTKTGKVLASGPASVIGSVFLGGGKAGRWGCPEIRVENRASLRS